MWAYVPLVWAAESLHRCATPAVLILTVKMRCMCARPCVPCVKSCKYQFDQDGLTRKGHQIVCRCHRQLSWFLSGGERCRIEFLLCVCCLTWQPCQPTWQSTRMKMPNRDYLWSPHLALNADPNCSFGWNTTYGDWPHLLPKARHALISVMLFLQSNKKINLLLE